jgi:hypothetical protein
VFRDNIPAIILAEWELSAEYFDKDFMSGVMPVLYARDPRAAEAGIKANPETAMKDLDKLNRIFFIPESVELSAALKTVKRARLGDVDFVFRRKNLDRNFNPEGFIQGKNIFKLHLIKFLKLDQTRLTYSPIYNRSHGSRLNKEQHAYERIG